ncbi:lipopolysaccharide biosynthesis protein [Streptacidiphilus sp. EB103A]|uniref:lipopolysaccharide biosynthesis protein n=1 Tax=Streptacidiphilus sp. EB103A TaxID=3156275 RepID=UPI0035177F8F
MSMLRRPERQSVEPRPGRRFLGGDPLLRNGALLTLASLSTSALGAGYWSLAGLRYDVATVGRNYSAISMMMFLAGVSQLNLADVLVRFTPAAGRATRRLILLAYLAAVCTALVASVGFVLAAPRLSPGLSFLHGPLLGTVFVVATVSYTVFSLQDGALTGLRRAGWVLAENALFSVAKLVAVLLLSLAAAVYGILASWTLALLVSLVFTNVYLFGFALPARDRADAAVEPGEAVEPVGPAGPRPADESTRGVVRYTGLTYVGGLLWLAVSNLPQVLILNTMGARDSAYFSISWVITTMLYVVSTNMGSSLVVESAGDPERLGQAVRKVLRSTGVLLLGAIVLLILAAPLVLRLFGPDYPRHATTLLRLLALSALPNLVTATALASFRVHRRLGLFVLVYAVLCAGIFGLCIVLVHRMGLAGMGLAYLLAQLAVAGTLLVFRGGWMPEPSAPAPAPAPESMETAEGAKR